MTIKNFWGSIIIMMLCLNTVPILPQKPVRKASVRKGSSTATKRATGRALAKKGVVKQAPVSQEQVVVETPTAPVQEISAQPVVTAPVVAVAQPVVPSVVQAPASEESQKKAWAEMQDTILALQGAQVFFHPTLSPFNGDPICDDAWSSEDSKATFRFSVAAQHDAVIQLIGESVRTITIGSYNNSNFTVRMGDINASAIKVPVIQGMNILEGENVYAPFWVSYNKVNGELIIGKGSVGSNILMKWNDPTPFKSDSIKLGLGGWAHQEGSKVFYTNIYPVLPSGIFALAMPSTSAIQMAPIQKTQVVSSPVSGVKAKTTIAPKGRGAARTRSTATGTSAVKTQARKTSAAKGVVRKTSVKRVASVDNAS